MGIKFKLQSKVDELQYHRNAPYKKVVFFDCLIKLFGSKHLKFHFWIN